MGLGRGFEGEVGGRRDRGRGGRGGEGVRGRGRRGKGTEYEVGRGCSSRRIVGGGGIKG